MDVVAMKMESSLMTGSDPKIGGDMYGKDGGIGGTVLSRDGKELDPYWDDEEW